MLYSALGGVGRTYPSIVPWFECSCGGSVYIPSTARSRRFQGSAEVHQNRRPRPPTKGLQFRCGICTTLSAGGYRNDRMHWVPCTITH